jgi:anti-sigma factor RsiW
MLAATATDACQTWREDGPDNARLRSAAHAGVHRQSFQQPRRGSRTHRLKKTTIAFTAALVAASASLAQVSLGTGAQAGGGTGATVTLPAPATGQGTATTGVGTGASVELPAAAAENGAKTEAGVKTEAAAEVNKTPSGKARKKSTTELGAGAAGNASGSTFQK